MIINYVFLLTIFLTSIFANNLEFQEDVTLPKLFYFNDTEECSENEYFYKLNIKLKPLDANNPSDTWKAILKKNREQDYDFNYDREWIFRGYCSSEMKKLENVLKEDLKSVGLVPDFEETYCSKLVNPYKLWDGIDILFILICTVYMIFFIYCTIKSYEYSKLNPDDYYFDKMNKYVKSFSPINTWRQLFKPNENEDFQKLSSIQGIRCISSLVVVSSHNFMTQSWKFSYNPEYLEGFFTIPTFYISVGFAALMIDIFFVISLFLLAVRLRNILKKNGELTFKDVAIVSINRYFRYVPMLIFLSFSQRSNMRKFTAHPLFHAFINVDINRCRMNWWQNFLFIQNWEIIPGGLCYAGLWYIAVDTQLYWMMTIAFYFAHKFKIPLKRIYAGLIAIGICLHYCTILLNRNELEPILRAVLKLFPHETAFDKKEFLYQHIHTFIHIGPAVIGFIFGCIYSDRKHEDIFNTKAKKIGWFLSSTGLIFLLSYLFLKKYSFQVEALKAVTFRIFFGVGSSILILGFATNTGGFSKRFFEWKPFLIMANFTFSIYMFHFITVFTRALSADKMSFHGHGNLARTLSIDLISSFSVGIFMYFVLETPCFQLQKIFLPQIKTKKEEVKKKGK